MRNATVWYPTKFHTKHGVLRASPNPAHVGERSRLITDLMARAYQRAVSEHARGVLADVGCGNAPLYSLYRPLVERVLCIDWPNSVHGRAFVDCYANLSTGLPLAPASLDTVLATDVLEHLSMPQAFFSEVARVLRDGGKLILGTPFLYWIHEAPHDYFRVTRFGLQHMCENSHLEVARIDEYGGPLAAILDLAGKIIPTRTAARIFQACARTFVRSPIGQFFDKRRQRDFPLGYCLVAVKRGGPLDAGARSGSMVLK